MSGLAPLVHLEQSVGLAPDPLRRLAALAVFDGTELRLSKKDQRRLGQYQSMISTSETASELGYRYGRDIARDVLLLRAVLLEMPLDPEAMRAAEVGSNQKCPVKPGDLMPAYSGAALGEKLREVEETWIASGFTLSKTDLLG